MGITKINKLLKELSSEAFYTSNLSDLKGHKIAIDAYNWMYSNMYTARKIIINKMTTQEIINCDIDPIKVRKEWFQLALRFLFTLLGQKITPIFVFDGVPPDEKFFTKEKRKRTKSQKQDKILILKQNFKNGMIIDKEKLKHTIRSCIIISYDDICEFRKLLCSIGIPCLQAKQDGEQLCSMLCLEGKVSAVFSADTDNLVYGCPLVINKFVKNKNNPLISCVSLKKSLLGLDMDQKTFVDLAIMSGCDYNKHMKNVPSDRIYHLLKKYGSIDNLPSEYDISCLNHQKCRDLFKTVPSETISINIPDNNYLCIDFLSIKQHRDFFVKYDLEHTIPCIESFFSQLQKISV